MRTIIIAALLLFSHICIAQNVEKLNQYIPSQKSTTQNPLEKSYQLNRNISSLAIEIKPSFTFEESFIVADSDTFFLKEDNHRQDFNSTFSSLVIFPEPVNSIKVIYGSIRDSVNLFFINDYSANSFEGKAIINKFASKKSGYIQPAMIDQSVWRAGLDEPDFERIVHEVKAAIVHHSASSNLVTDYTSAVRNIYLYHTAVRGWSDIGYNYVIVPNGDIYKGRDPGEHDQDDVMGAHFCASNRGTMGICMLGTFTEIAPTDTAFASLEEILVWKLGKDGLDPLSQYAHPLNSDLDVISGHRDGCATECPGEIMYSRLGLLRDRVNNKIIISGIDLIGITKNQEETIHLFPNPVNQALSITSPQRIEKISILNLQGKIISNINSPDRTIDLSDLKGGTYILKITSGASVYTRRIIKR